MEMIKFLDKDEIEKIEHDKFLKETVFFNPIESESPPPFPQSFSGAYNLVSNPCTMTPKQLRKYASRLI